MPRKHPIKSERVTCWFVVTGKARPKLVSIEGTKSAKAIRLDQRDPIEYLNLLVGAAYEAACYTPAEAIEYHVNRTRKDVVLQRRLVEEAERHLSNAIWMRDEFKAEQQQHSRGPVWCDVCGCNTARPCVCARDCQAHPSARRAG